MVWIKEGRKRTEETVPNVSGGHARALVHLHNTGQKQTSVSLETDVWFWNQNCLPTGTDVWKLLIQTSVFVPENWSQKQTSGMKWFRRLVQLQRIGIKNRRLEWSGSDVCLVSREMSPETDVWISWNRRLFELWVVFPEAFRRLFLFKTDVCFCSSPEHFSIHLPSDFRRPRDLRGDWGSHVACGRGPESWTNQHVHTDSRINAQTQIS